MRRRILTATLTTLTLSLGACGGAASLSPASPEAPEVSEAEMSAGYPGGALAQPGYGDAPSAELAGVDEEVAGDADEAPPMAAPVPEPSMAVAGRADGARKEEAGAARRPSVATSAAGVRAGEWDDNANYREFQKYLGSQAHLGFEQVDLSSRRFLVVRDAQGRGVPNCRVNVADGGQRSVSLTTTASGRAILFPRAEGLAGRDLVATTRCQGLRGAARFDLTAPDGAVALDLQGERALPSRPVVDLAFVLDTTGSMSEEIAAVKQTIQQVASALRDQNFDVRIGLVEYRDKTDAFVTRVHPMSKDLSAFSLRVAGISAGGGGDMPEHANEGLRVALQDLAWSPDSVARMAFVIADAPPHLDYQDDVSYAQSMRAASHDGIQLFTVAASGMDDMGQAVWRQIAQYTGGTNLFVLRGGAGPQSTGGGDPKSSCGGTHENYSSGNLHQLITRKVVLELSALEADPMRIAGLDQDENAKPCEKRIFLVAR